MTLDGALSRIDWGFVYVASEWLVRVAALVYVPQRRPPSAARAWLLLIFFLPWPGVRALPAHRPRVHAAPAVPHPEADLRARAPSGGATAIVRGLGRAGGVARAPAGVAARRPAVRIPGRGRQSLRAAAASTTRRSTRIVRDVDGRAALRAHAVLHLRERRRRAARHRRARARGEARRRGARAHGRDRLARRVLRISGPCCATRAPRSSR